MNHDAWLSKHKHNLIYRTLAWNQIIIGKIISVKNIFEKDITPWKNTIKVTIKVTLYFLNFVFLIWET